MRPYGVIVDAQVELGRYDAGRAHASARWSTCKPNLASYARVSYFRELHGDLDGALDAMRLAVSAGGDAPENLAYVQTLLGNLEFDRGSLGAARRAYRLALARYPRLRRPPTPAWRASRPRAGDLGPAIRRYRSVVARLPLPEYVDRARRGRAGRRPRAPPRAGDFALVASRAAPAAQRTASTPTPSWPLFEANHGSPARAVDARPPGLGARAERALGRRARLGADAGRPARRGPSLGASGRCGSARVDPAFLYHAGIERHGRRAARASRAAGSTRALGAQPALVAALRAAGRARARGPAMRARRPVDRSPPGRAASAVLAPAASAHPLGNFSINHITQVRVSADRVDALLHPRPGRDPDLPGARPLARRRCSTASGRRSRADCSSR